MIIWSFIEQLGRARETSFTPRINTLTRRDFALNGIYAARPGTIASVVARASARTAPDLLESSSSSLRPLGPPL